MPKFPNPPPLSVLAEIPPSILVIPRGTLVWRVYFRGGSYPAAWNSFRGFGPVATARFDHHLPPPAIQSREIFYGAIDGETCVAEVFQATRTIDPTRRDPWLVGFELARDLDLLDLTGTWPTAAGASVAISSGPRARARRWSQAVYAAYPTIHGLWYPSSMYGNAPAFALYERAMFGMPSEPIFHRPLHHPVLDGIVRTLASRIRYKLVVRWN